MAAAKKNTDLISGRKDIGYMGEDYQYKLVKCFMEDNDYFCSIQHLVNQNMFTVTELRTLVGFMKDRYADIGRVTLYSELEMYVRREIMDEITKEKMIAIIERVKNGDLEGMDMVEREAEHFFKQQNLIQAINKATEIIRRGRMEDYPEIESLFQDALSVNLKDDIGQELFESDAQVESDLSPDYRKTITTGTKELDDALGGGIGSRELGVIVAPSNVGKSSVVTGFAAAAATTKTEHNNNQGYKVLHIFFEDEEVNIRRKYYGYLLDIDACMLHHPDIRPLAIEKLTDEFNEERDMLKRNVRYIRLSSGEKSASDIKAIINKHISLGFKPDLVVIDYFECLKKEKGMGRNDSEWSGETVTMRKLESMAKELGIAIWVPVQGTKGSFGQEYVSMAHAGGSVGKTQIGHIVIQLARTDEQKTRGLMNVYIGKMRATKFVRDKFLNVKFNNGTCHFDMSMDGEDFVDNDFDNPTSNHMQVARDVASNHQP